MQKCREQFQTMVNFGVETGVCQLDKNHKGPHDCTVIRLGEPKSITGEGSELPALHVRKGIGESSTEFENRCRRERERQLLTAISEITKLKSALFSPQQEPAEDAWKRGIKTAASLAFQYWGSSFGKEIEKLLRNPYVAPPVTAEGTNEK